MAQLVAHHTGSVGVRGSSPLSSTTRKDPGRPKCRPGSFALRPDSGCTAHCRILSIPGHHISMYPVTPALGCFPWPAPTESRSQNATAAGLRPSPAGTVGASCPFGASSDCVVVCPSFATLCPGLRNSIACGAMAQLVAHHTGSVGVRGSSPLSSTTSGNPPVTIDRRVSSFHHRPRVELGDGGIEPVYSVVYEASSGCPASACLIRPSASGTSGSATPRASVSTWSSRLNRRRASGTDRSEERRVGKECRSRWSPYH